MELNKTKILALSSIVEGALTLLFCIWAFSQDVSYSVAPSLSDLKFGILFTIPLLVFNYLVFGPLCERFSVLSGCKYFKEKIVKPLADELDFVSAFCTAFAAGIGEELFFRGVLQTEFGIHVASILFAVLHFGPALRSYYLIATIYLVFGYYFGFMRVYTNSLWAPIIAHGLYDYFALLYMRYLFQPKQDEVVSAG